MEKVREDLPSDGPSLRPLCPTRWTVKAKSFGSVLMNYEALLETLHTIVSEKDGTFEVVAKAGGIHKNMENLFGIMLGEKFLGITDLLSSSLQGKNVIACNARAASDTVCENLVKMREDTVFDTFWEFDQKSFYLYLRLEQLVLKAASTGEILDDNLGETCQHFDLDFDQSRLRNLLAMAVLHDLVSCVNPSLPFKISTKLSLHLVQHQACFLKCRNVVCDTSNHSYS